MKRLFEVYKDYFTIGAAVSGRTIETHKDLILEHFNSLTAENEMKPFSLQPKENVFDFSKAEKMVKVSKENNKLLRGHTLMWHNGNPDWIFSENGEPLSRDTAINRMKKHINNVLDYYDGIAYGWDVVNEVIGDNDQPPLRQTPWLKAIGEDYLEIAYKTAREHKSGIKLYCNDYNECDPIKRGRICDLIKSLNSKEKLVDGFGMQGHYNIYHPNMDMVRESIEAYAALDIEIQVTELDVSIFRFEDDTKYETPPQELLDKQADYYGELFKIYREYKKYITSVILWGVADDATWLSNFPFRGRKNWPLLFDDNHQPKSAFSKIINF